MDASRRVFCDEIESSREAVRTLGHRPGRPRSSVSRPQPELRVKNRLAGLPCKPPVPPARVVRTEEQLGWAPYAAARAHRGAHAGSRSPRHAFGAHGIMSAARMAPLSAQEEQDKWLAGARPTRAPWRRPRPHFSPGVVVVAARARIRARPAHSPSLNSSPRLRSSRRRRPEPRQAVRLLHETRAGASPRDVRPFARRRKRRHRPRVPDLTS